MKPTVSYQGYRNAQTWCVCNAFKNNIDLHNAALTIVRRERASHVVCETLLRSIAARNFALVCEVAPWAWLDGQTLSDVFWREIRVKLSERYVTA